MGLAGRFGIREPRILGQIRPEVAHPLGATLPVFGEENDTLVVQSVDLPTVDAAIGLHT